MNESYVLVYARPFDTTKNKVLLTLKDRPVWQKGRLNLPGGKIEPNESVSAAALRELYEETGLHGLEHAKLMGHIEDKGSIIYVVQVTVSSNQELKPAAGETEPVAWYDWTDVRDDKRLMPNLLIIMPLVRQGLDMWVIRDDAAWGPDSHEISVEVFNRGTADVEPSVKESSPRKPKPEVVCLCGSTLFMDEYIQAQKQESLAGKIVLSVGLFGHHEGLDMGGETKKMLDELHLRKIDLADSILVIDKNRYIGSSTAREIEYARSKNKRIRYWSQQ